MSYYCYFTGLVLDHKIFHNNEAEDVYNLSLDLKFFAAKLSGVL